MFDAVQALKDLVRINTTNPPGNELEALVYIRNLLAGHGIEAAIQKSDRNRGNLLALLPAKQQSGKPPLVLMSHIDVVGADEGAWRYPPFSAHETGDGYIYGRGTVDTKQLTVMELAALCALQKMDTGPDRDVYLLATCDEESGSEYGLQYFLQNPVTVGGRTATGAQLMQGCEAISEGGGFPVYAGEKQFYLCETGQKSCGTLRFTVQARHGKGPFLPSGDGMARAMRLAGAIGALQLEKKLLPTAQTFENSLRDALGGGEGWQEQLSKPMRGILNAIGRNTITVTMVEGQNLNEVAVTCDVRLVPGFGEDYLRGIAEGLCAEYDCEYEIVSLGTGYESGAAGGLAAHLEKATLDVLGDKAGNTSLLPFISMGASDGRFLAPLGAKVYGYSPVYGWDMTFDTAVAMVHSVNERIHKDSLLFGCEVLRRAVLAAAGVKDSE